MCAYIDYYYFKGATSIFSDNMGTESDPQDLVCQICQKDERGEVDKIPKVHSALPHCLPCSHFLAWLSRFLSFPPFLLHSPLFFTFPSFSFSSPRLSCPPLPSFLSVSLCLSLSLSLCLSLSLSLSPVPLNVCLV